MTEKMTNAQMGQTLELLSKLHETGKLGYAIARNTRKITDAAKEYLEMQSQLFQKYGTVGEDGKTATIKGQDNIKAFTEEMGDIPQIEHEVEIFKVSEDVFTSGGLTSNQMMGLLWMVEE